MPGALSAGIERAAFEQRPASSFEKGRRKGRDTRCRTAGVAPCHDRQKNAEVDKPYDVTLNRISQTLGVPADEIETY